MNDNLLNEAFQQQEIQEQLEPALSYKEAAEKLRKQVIDGEIIIPTFIPELDRMLDGGLRQGEVFVLSAPTKNGKTVLSQTISYNQSLHAFPALWFTLELSWQELTRNFIRIDGGDMANPRDLPLFYPMKNKGLSLEWMRQVIKKEKAERGIAMVFIDHLHFLLPLHDFHTNVSFILGAIVREIKKMAVELEVPILLIAHMKKPNDDDRNPDMNMIRDSSFITQETDYTAVMWRVKNANSKKQQLSDIYMNEAILSLEANRRNGKTGKVRLIHDGLKFLTEEQYEQTLGSRNVSDSFNVPTNNFQTEDIGF